LTAQGFQGAASDRPQSLFAGPFGGFLRSYLLMIAVSTGVVGVLQLVYIIVLHVAMASSRTTRYGFAHRTVRLASLGRRALARAIDTAIGWIPLGMSAGWLFARPDVLNVERLLQQANANPLQVIQTIALVVLALLMYGVTAIVIFGSLEGLYGWSPGKLVCGLRVIRTTLQPIGVFRGLIRQFLLVIDSQFTYLVGCAMIAVLVKRQRLGDLAADSLVVEAASLMEIAAVPVEYPT
jgi:uncharacterized RDD family membrane protein YckC